MKDPVPESVSQQADPQSVSEPRSYFVR